MAQSREIRFFQIYHSSILGLIALLALAVATWTYVGERSANAVPPLFVAFNIAEQVDPLLGAAAGSFPTFGHVFALSIFTGLLLGRSRRSAFFACCSWALINVCFEVGQHAAVAESAAALVPATFPFGTYFTSGTFDVLDIFAATVGAAAAYKLLSSRSYSSE